MHNKKLDGEEEEAADGKHPRPWTTTENTHVRRRPDLYRTRREPPLSTEEQWRLKRVFSNAPNPEKRRRRSRTQLPSSCSQTQKKRTLIFAANHRSLSSVDERRQRAPPAERRYFPFTNPASFVEFMQYRVPDSSSLLFYFFIIKKTWLKLQNSLLWNLLKFQNSPPWNSF